MREIMVSESARENARDLLSGGRWNADIAARLCLARTWTAGEGEHHCHLERGHTGPHRSGADGYEWPDR